MSTNTLTNHWHSNPTSCAALNDWLFAQGSLTQRLTAVCRTGFRVQLINEGWQTLSDSECAALNIIHNSRGWVREVFLCDGQQPWVFARSVASQTALHTANFDISQLGTRSLGELLFSDPAFNRGPMYISQLSSMQLPAQAQQQIKSEQLLWARRSCFQKNSLAVLVAEVFLPQFWQDNGLSKLNL
ncbi:MAG TPA: chorismate lyase [Thiopseudomonas sp.]|nr:chorismate lyase [Thiopseudomonas sp.]